MSPTPWRVEWTNFGQSIGYDSRSRIVDAEGNWVAEIGDGVWDRIAQHEALASLIVSAVNERESQAAQIAALTAELSDRQQGADVEARMGDEARAKVKALTAERDAITDLNHSQWCALENVRLLAARHRKEEWAQHMLRFCEEAGNRSVAIAREAVDAARTQAHKEPT